MGKIERLFSEFSPVTTSEWEEKIQQDLKGQPCDKLIWNSPEGFAVKAYYRNEDLEGLEYLKNIPGPFIAGNTLGQNNWEIRQDIIVDDWSEANEAALEALNKGATSLGFIIPGTKRIDGESMRTLLNDIYIDCINLNFDVPLQAEKVITLLPEIADENGMDASQIKGSVDGGPLGYLTTHGDYPGGTEKAFEDLASLVRQTTLKCRD